MTIQISNPGSNAVRSRSSNRQAVLGRIQSVGHMGRAEIARALGLSTQAVSNIISELVCEGLLIEIGTISAGRGLPAMQYGVNPEGGYALGIEIRPDAILATLVDLHGTVVAQRRHALKKNAPERVVAKVLKIRDGLLSNADVSAAKVMGVGIVMPGPFGKTGLFDLRSDLTGWASVDARAMFEGALGAPVEVSNDANAAAMSERISTGLNNFAYLYFGAGLGLGLVNQSQLVAGAFGNAGEIGHVTITTDSGPSTLEGQLSRVSLESCMNSGTSLDIEAIAGLYQKGDPHFMRWLDSGAVALSQALGLIENLFDPQTVILGGAMPEVVLDHLIEQTVLPEQSVSNRQDNPMPRLQRGTCGRMTATLGAAALILNRAFTPQTASL